MSSSITTEMLSERRQELGKWLYVIAWAIEICAIGVGLAIGAWMVISAIAPSEGVSRGLNLGAGGNFLNAVIAFLPFFMVSVIEAAKIPFVRASYAVPSLFWKFVFSLVLMFLAIITFESAFNGFERFFYEQTRGLSEKQEDLQKINETVATQEALKTRTEQLNLEEIEDVYSKAMGQYQSEAQQRRQPILHSIEKAQARLQRNIRIEQVERQLAEKREDIRQRQANYSEELEKIERRRETNQKNITSELGTQRRTLAGQLDNKRGDLNSARRQMRQAVDDKGLFQTRETIEEPFKARIKKLESEIEKLETAINGLSVSGASEESSSKLDRKERRLLETFNQDIKVLRAALARIDSELTAIVGATQDSVNNLNETSKLELRTIDRSIGALRSEAKANRDRDLSELANQTAKIKEIDVRLEELTNDRDHIRSKINEQTANNQVYRFAKRIFKVEAAADLGSDKVMMVFIVWFGSLSALIAFSGVFLALASEVARDTRRFPVPPPPDEAKKKFSATIKELVIGIFNSLKKLVDSFRRLVVFFRTITRRGRTIEVVKEVPVEKIVFRDVPQEILIKEIVHVPMFTSNPVLANIQYAQPKEQVEESSEDFDESPENEIVDQPNPEVGTDAQNDNPSERTLKQRAKKTLKDSGKSD
jgi:hypothetical protein